MAAKKPAAILSLKQLAANLSESHKLSKKQTEAVLGDLVGLVTKHLKKGERIRIGGLEVRKRAASEKGGSTYQLRPKKSGQWVSVSVKPRTTRVGQSNEIVGKTSDGITILRAKVKPKHFTSRQIRETISEVKKAAPG